jgi:hypothetical protein
MEEKEQFNTSVEDVQNTELKILGGEPKKTKSEYFSAVTSGKLPMDAKEQIKATNGEDMPLASSMDLWSNAEVKKKYQDQFGDKAKENFDDDYNSVSSMYNGYQFLLGGKNTKKAILEGIKLDDEIEVAGIKMSGFSPKFFSIDKTEDGSLDLFDIHTDANESTRKKAIERHEFYDPATNQWKKLKKPTLLESIGSLLTSFAEASGGGNLGLTAKKIADNVSPIDNPLYTDSKGNQIKALVYVTGDELRNEMLNKDPYSQYGEAARGKSYQKAVYYGEEIGDKEVVSKLDFLGFTTPQLNVGKTRALASALPRAVINTASGVVGGVASSMIALNDLVVTGDDNDTGFRKYLESLDASVKASKMSVSEESKNDPYTFENISTGFANVSTQLALGFGAASIAGKAGSISALTSMAVEGSRDEAIAAGFTQEEAATFQMASIAAMAATNKLFSWVDKKTEASLFKQKVSEIVKEKLAYTTTQVAKETTKQGRTKAVMDGADKIYVSIKNLAKSTGGAIPEGMEEVTEGIANHALKQLQNITFKDDDQKGFMSLNDPQFLKSFYAEMGMSFVMGSIGGAMADGAIKLFYKGRNTEDKYNVTNLILSDKGIEYVNFITKLRNEKDGLGSDNLSTEFDNKSQSFKTITEGSISHNEANYQLLLNEYNAISKVIEGIGAKKAFDLVKNNDDFKDSELAGTAIKDIQKLTVDYLDIISKTPNLKDAALDINMNFESDAKKEEYFEKVASEYNTDSDSIKKLYDIKKEINSINKGHKTEEYIFSKLINIDRPEKYDENFTSNLFKSLKKQQEEREKHTETLHEISKESEEVANTIDDKLSNIDSLFDLKIISKKAKDILNKKFEKATAEPEDLNYLKASLTEKYLAKDEKGSFLNKDVANEIENVAKNIVAQELQEDPDINVEERLVKIENLLTQVHESFYKKSIDKLNTVSSVVNFKPLSFMKSPFKNEDGSFVYDFSGVKDFIEDNGYNANEMTNALLEDNSADLDNNTAGNQSNLRITDGKVLEILEKNNELKSKINKINAVTDETLIESPNYNFGFVYDEIYGSGDKVNIGASFYNRLHGNSSIHEEFKSKEINGVNLFDNINETKELLDQLKIKKSLLNGMAKYHNQLSDYKSSFDKIMSTLNSKETRTVDDIMKAIHSTTFQSEFMTNFNKVAFDSRLLRVLRNKYRPIIKQHNQELTSLNEQLSKEVENGNAALINEITGKISSKNAIHNKEIASLNQLENVSKVLTNISRDINDNINKLESYLQVAEANQNIENQLSNRINGIANNIKSNVNAVNDFLDLIHSSIDPKVNNLIDKDDKEVKEFLNYFNNEFKESAKNEETLKKDNKILYNFYDYLRNAKDKYSLNSALFVYFNSEVTPKDNNSNFNRILIASQFDIREFDKRFDKLTKESPYLAYAEQQEVALTVAAHLNTDVSNLYTQFIKSKDIAFKRKVNKIPENVSVESDLNINSSNVMTLFGTAGSGKSTFGIGIGVNIGLDIKSEGEVFLSSNTEPQLNTLIDTSLNFKFDDKILSKSTLEGLISFLEDVNTGKISKDISDKLSVIVYDEATVPSSDALEKDAQVNTKYDINKVLYLVEEINKSRPKSKQIKAILSGDPNQNGFVEVKHEGGVQIHARNIGVNRSAYFGSKYLDLNIRSKVQAISDIANIIKSGNYHMGEMVGNSPKFKSSFGYHALTDTKLGAQFTADLEILNDESIIKNIEDNINKNLNFKVGIVGNDINVKGRKITEDANSKLEELILKYPTNFEFYTHEKVQGQTFDYTICTMDTDTFYDNNKVWNINDIYNGESYIAKKLATTIERSKYYTLVINKTKRKFESEESGTLVLADPKLDTEIVGAVKEFLFKTRTDYDTVKSVEEKVEEKVENKKDNAIKVIELLTEPQDTITPEQLTLLNDNKDLVEKVNSVKNNPEEMEKLTEFIINTPEIEVEEIPLVIENKEDLKAIEMAEQLEEIDTEASDIQRAMFEDMGLLSGYFKGDVLEGSDDKFGDVVLKNLLNNKFDQFDYEFITVPSIASDGTSVIKPYIKIAKKDGSLFSSIRIFVPSEDNAFNAFIKNNGEKIIKLNPNQVKSFIDNITSGKVNTGENISLEKLRTSLLNKGLSVSENIYVYTSKTTGDNGNNAGDAFILYSQKEVDLDTDMGNKNPENLTVSFDLKSIEKKVRRFRNSVGVIKLNLKPVEKFSDLYKSYNDLIKAKVSNINASKFLNSCIAAHGPSAKMLEFMCLFVEKYNNKDYSYITNNIPANRKRDLSTGIDNIIKENEGKFDSIIDIMQQLIDGSVGLDGKLTPKNLFSYSIDNGRKRCFLNFDLLLRQFSEDDLSDLDKIFNVGFPKGIYARFKAIKTGKSANKLFAQLDRESIENITEAKKFNLDNNYTVNVDINNPIKTPIVYISNSKLLSSLTGLDNVKKENIPVVKKNEIELAIENFNSSDTDSKQYKDILQYIDELPTSKLAQKNEKKRMESLLSSKLKENNKNPMDSLFEAVENTKLYKSPEMFIDADNNVDIRGKVYDPSNFEDNIALNDFVNKELLKLNYTAENKEQIAKTLDFVNSISNILSEDTLNNINEKSHALDLDNKFTALFPAYNLNSKLVKKNLSKNFKLSILNDEKRLENYKLALVNSNSDLSFLNESFNPTEITAIKEYLSSLQNCN